MKLNRIIPLCLLAMLPFRTVAIAQETREEAQRQQREEKQQTVTPYEPNLLERALKAIETGGIPLITRDGIYAKLGSITTGSGFAYGAGYRSRRLFGADAALDVWGGASLKGTGQGRHAFGFRILPEADFWPRATAGATSIHRKTTLVSVRTRFGPRRPTFSCALRRLARERLCAWLPSSRSVGASSTTSPESVTAQTKPWSRSASSTTRRLPLGSQRSPTISVPSRLSRSTRGGR